MPTTLRPSSDDAPRAYEIRGGPVSTTYPGPQAPTKTKAGVPIARNFESLFAVRLPREIPTSGHGRCLFQEQPRL